MAARPDDHALALTTPASRPDGRWDLKLGHYNKGIEVVDVGGRSISITALRLRELLIDLVSKNSYQLVVNMDKVQTLRLHRPRRGHRRVVGRNLSGAASISTLLLCRQVKMPV